MTKRASESGFSLIEIAIGLVILGLAAVGIVASLSAQAEQRRYTDTRAQLAQAREALLAFITTHGRLPCPATTTSNGQESPPGGGACTTQSGLLPAVTLGMPELTNGLLLDAWRDGNGAARSIRYGTSSLTPSLVTNALTSQGLGAPTSNTRRADVLTAMNNNQGVFVCRSATGIASTGNRCGNPGNLQTDRAVAVVWTAAANAITSNASADELQNQNQTIARVYISRDFAPIGATGGNFDDLVTWIPYSLMADRLLTAGHVR